jgi:hypothetical protein
VFSQVPKASAISKHFIHGKSFLVFEAIPDLRLFFFSAEDLELRRETFIVGNISEVKMGLDTSKLTK